MADRRPWSEFDPVYDLPPPTGPVRTYLIATTQRTGSHYLASLLAELGTVGVPFEYLNGYRCWLEFQQRGWSIDEAASVRLYQEMVSRRTGTSGWFGLKAHWHTWQEMMAAPALANLVRPERFIVLSRNDRVAQAVSLALAEQTGVWVDTGQQAQRPPTYSRAHIESARERLATEQDAWRNYLAGIDALQLTYEGLLADPVGTVTAVLTYLGVTEPPPTPRALPALYPRSDDMVERWAERYRAET